MTGLGPGDVSSMNNTTDVKKHYEYALDELRFCCALFSSEDESFFRCVYCCLISGSSSRKPNFRHVMILDMKYGSLAAHWWRSWQISTLLSSCSVVNRWGIMFAEKCRNSDDRSPCTNSYDRPWTSAMSFNILGWPSCTAEEFTPQFPKWHLRRSYRKLFVFREVSSALYALVPLETLSTTHCLVAVVLLKHYLCLSSRVLVINAKNHAGCLYL